MFAEFARRDGEMILLFVGIRGVSVALFRGNGWVGSCRGL